ncbi:hypothetical protein FSP39_010893 [Pinctada imbricata]|uniref:Uncharacterized protein n=1 Tax=Pinctada imbricata TaxID=66713 RepID=A0AA89BM72_PINIB|nr:hypothetical protein FSP39_010893 [Pinctada imbricata]
MNKVLHDQPEDPLVFLIKALYRKAGLEAPQELKHGRSAMRQSSPERAAIRNRSPEMSRKAATQAWASGRKPQTGKQTWNPDTKVQNTSFDDLFTENKEGRKSPVKKEETTATRRNWATFGLDDGDVAPYTSGVYHGPRRIESDDPLAGEIMNSRESPQKAATTEADIHVLKSKSRVKGRGMMSMNHRKELEEAVKNADQHSDDSGYNERDQADDAIELLEDAEELQREGVTNIPESGYRLSKMLRQRQEDTRVKLNINLYPGAMPSDSLMGDRYDSMKSMDSFRGYESDDERPQTGMSGFRTSPGGSDIDEEFESVSQVTGPRRPVWNVGADSDVETFTPAESKKPPSLSQSRKMTTSQDKKFSATLPAKYGENPASNRPRESIESFTEQPCAKTWTPGNQGKSLEAPAGVSVQESVRSESGVWQIPRADSETSLSEWTQNAGKSGGKRPPPRDNQTKQPHRQPDQTTTQTNNHTDNQTKQPDQTITTRPNNYNQTKQPHRQPDQTTTQTTVPNNHKDKQPHRVPDLTTTTRLNNHTDNQTKQPHRQPDQTTTTRPNNHTDNQTKQPQRQPDQTTSQTTRPDNHTDNQTKQPHRQPDQTTTQTTRPNNHTDNQIKQPHRQPDQTTTQTTRPNNHTDNQIKQPHRQPDQTTTKSTRPTITQPDQTTTRTTRPNNHKDNQTKQPQKQPDQQSHNHTEQTTMTITRLNNHLDNQTK